MSFKNVLKITEALNEDIGKDIVRIDPEIIEGLKLKINDTLEIINPATYYRTAATLKEGRSEDRGNKEIKLDKYLRRNLGAPIGAKININKIDTEIAEEIIVSLMNKKDILENTQDLSKNYLDFVVIKDDILSFFQNNKRYDLLVEYFSPEGYAAKISQHTKFLITKSSHTEFMESLVIDAQEEDEEVRIIEKLRKVAELSSEIKIEMLRNILNMEEDIFKKKINEWEKEFDFKIIGDYIRFEHDSISKFIETLEDKFAEWTLVEKSSFSKKEPSNKFVSHRKISRIFKDETKLDANFLPDKLPHRDKEMAILFQLFLTLVTNPKSMSRQLLITGPKGSGKSSTIKMNIEILKNNALKRGNLIKTAFLSCRWENTSRKIIERTLKLINVKPPKRETSNQILFNFLIDSLKDLNTYLIVVLDDLSYLLDNSILLLCQKHSLEQDTSKFLSLIGIVIDLESADHLELDKTQLQRNIVKFSHYSKNQFFDIIKYRVKLSLKENIISDRLMTIIASVAFDTKDLNYGLGVLWRACRIAESMNLPSVSYECFSLANREIDPFLTKHLIKLLDPTELVILLTFVKILKESEDNKIIMQKFYHRCNLEHQYLAIVPSYNNDFTDFLIKLMEFKWGGVITIQGNEKNKTYMAIDRQSLAQLEENFILQLIELKLPYKLRRSLYSKY